MSRFVVRIAGFALAATALLGLAAGPAAAQETGSVRGRVVEAATGRPLSGAQVYIAGTDRGAIANASGEYLLLNVPAGSHTVTAEMLGYSRTQVEVVVSTGQVASANFELSQQAISMDAIVVTGTAGAVSKRTVTN